MEQFYDYRLATHTIETLKTVSEIDAPWFVMAGFRRPHRDFFVHQQYWDLYPDQSKMHVALHNKRDPSQPEVAFHAAGCTLPNGTTVPGDADHPWPVEVQQWFRTGYYAAVSQTDAQVGRVLDALDDLNLTDSTIVVMHADHGWQLGEHGLWDKQTEFELATRVPLLIKAPHKKASVGQHTASLTELVDLHPTLQSLAGVPTPQTPTPLPPSLPQGTDLSPLFDNPAASLKNYTMSQFPNCGIPGKECVACTGPRSFRTSIQAMGYSIRTDKWRYTTCGQEPPLPPWLPRPCNPRTPGVAL